MVIGNTNSGILHQLYTSAYAGILLHIPMSKSRYKYEADITCICGILYLKFNRIDAINSHQNLNYSMIP